MSDLSNTIACIGWGSLVWEPKALPLDSDWYFDGPTLPVEFARQSKNGRLTLVLLPSAPPVTTCWAKLRVPTLELAREALRVREETPLHRIGYWPSGIDQFTDHIGEWATAKGLNGVVWTALPPRFLDENDRVPTIGEAVAYLSGLSGSARDEAERYVRNAPASIQTPYRAAFERELGWTADPLSLRLFSDPANG